MAVYALILLAFFADRISKWWASAYLAEHGPARINHLFTIRETYNSGMALGLFPGTAPLLGWFSVIVVLGLVYYLQRWPRQARLARVGLALLIGGALGNLVDRILLGRVLDFIQMPLRPSVFNVADVLIHGGIVLFALDSLRARHKVPPAHEQTDDAQSKETTF